MMALAQRANVSKSQGKLMRTAIATRARSSTLSLIVPALPFFFAACNVISEMDVQLAYTGVLSALRGL